LNHIRTEHRIHLSISLIIRLRHNKKKNQENSVITRSHLSSKIFTASVNSTSGGNAPVDSIETRQTSKKYTC